MRFLLLIVALAVSSCSFDPYITHRAGVRRMAEARLMSCLGWGRISASEYQRQACKAESFAFCLSRGLERTCGIAGLWTTGYH